MKNMRWTALALVALGGLLLLAVAGFDEPRCTPAPEAPICADDDQCGAGEFCLEGLCHSWRACEKDRDCLEVPAGCCPCSMGGHSTAINTALYGQWQSHHDCPPDIACPAVYLCQDWTPACKNGQCTLVLGGLSID